MLYSVEKDVIGCRKKDFSINCEIFENLGNPWQSLESLSCPGKDLSPLECKYGSFSVAVGDCTNDKTDESH